MDKIKQVLTDLGFENKEIKIILALTKSGSLSALQLSKETGIDRTTVYDVLNKLINKGVVSSISKNLTTAYSCLEPEKLFLHFKEKYSALEGVLPNLINLQAKKRNDFMCETFQGKEGLKTVIKELVDSKAHYKVIGIRKEYEDLLGFFHEQGFLKINEAKIKETAIVEKGSKFKKTKNGDYKEVQKLSAPTTTVIYDDVVLFLIWSEPYQAIRIKNDLFRKNQEECFDLIWKK